MDILNLSGLSVVSVNDTESALDYYITAVSTVPITCCQACGVIKKENVHLSKFGTKKFVYMDVPIHGRRTVVGVVRQRYICNECKGTFYERLPDMHPDRMMTSRLVEYIQKQSLEETFSAIAERVGVDAKTVKNIFESYVKELEQKHVFEAPTWLGIDEIHMLGKPRCVLTNLEHRTIIDMLPDRDMKTLREYFLKTKGKRKIEYIAMDMWSGYRTIAKEIAPDAKVVIDKYHVLQYANYALEQVRKSIRSQLSDKERKRLMRNRFLLLRRTELNPTQKATLNEYLTTFPQLYNAYFLKEFFYEIYDSTTRDEATQRFRDWQAAITDDVALAFNPLVKMVNNWYTEIFNYFDAGGLVTNAYTESLNNVIRFVNRKGRGYSFEAIRAKILFTMKHKSPAVEAVKKADFRSKNFCRLPEQMIEYSYARRGITWTLGVPISILVQVLNDESS